jgi:hypothetical protein
MCFLCALLEVVTEQQDVAKVLRAEMEFLMRRKLPRHHEEYLFQSLSRDYF